MSAESWFEPAHSDPLPTAPSTGALLIDELSGELPTWRMDEEPIYLEVVRDLGVPGTLEGPAPGPVVAGEVLDPDDAEDDEADVDGEYPRSETPSASLTLVQPPAAASVVEPAPGRRQPRRKPPRARRAAS